MNLNSVLPTNLCDSSDCSDCRDISDSSGSSVSSDSNESSDFKKNQKMFNKKFRKILKKKQI